MVNINQTKNLNLANIKGREDVGDLLKPMDACGAVFLSARSTRWRCAGMLVGLASGDLPVQPPNSSGLCRDVKLL